MGNVTALRHWRVAQAALVSSPPTSYIPLSRSVHAAVLQLVFVGAFGRTGWTRRDARVRMIVGSLPGRYLRPPPLPSAHLGSPRRPTSSSSRHNTPVMTSLIRITAGPYTFLARFEDALAPLTVARFRTMLVGRPPL